MTKRFESPNTYYKFRIIIIIITQAHARAHTHTHARAHTSFEHVLWRHCSHNTFDGRLLWFDGVEGKRGLTLNRFFWEGAGGGAGVKLFHCIVRTGVYGILYA